MKIIRQSYENTSIGTEWEHQYVKVTIAFDDHELDARLKKRFRWVEVTQNQYKGSRLDTYMKGAHSCWFGDNGNNKDPEKKFIWDKICAYMEENSDLFSIKWQTPKRPFN